MALSAGRDPSPWKSDLCFGIFMPFLSYGRRGSHHPLPAPKCCCGGGLLHVCCLGILKSHIADCNVRITALLDNRKHRILRASIYRIILQYESPWSHSRLFHVITVVGMN